MNIFLTADTHFNHINIIKYCHRPFISIQEMNRILIKNWNSVVSQNDEVYVLGDFGFGCYKDLKPIFQQLNGKKILIRGNHDHKHVLKLPWQSVFEVHTLCKDNKKFYMKHKPASCNKCTKVFAGHKHRKKADQNWYIDVGVDAWNYFPVNLEELIEKYCKEK